MSRHKKVGWEPTTMMWQILRSCAVSEMFNPTLELRRRGLNIGLWKKWLKQPQFLPWFEAEWKTQMKIRAFDLDLGGYNKSEKDFRWWEAMQIKYGGYEKAGTKGGKIDIQMNIPRPVKQLPQKTVIEGES